MYNDSKLTYIIVAVLVVILGGCAYFLQSSLSSTSNGSEVATSTNTGTTTSTTTIPKATTTTTKPPMDTNNNIPQVVNGAVLHTNMGDITIGFDAVHAPKTVANFVSLAATKFYDGVRFHRVIKDFMIQTGDPLSKDVANVARWGTGGPGYTFADELSGKETYPQGTVAMANSGPNTNGSQFFIVTANPSYPLPPNYTVFGHVTDGIDVALKIQSVATSPNDRPLSDVIINSVTLK